MRGTLRPLPTHFWFLCRARGVRREVAKKSLLRGFLFFISSFCPSPVALLPLVRSVDNFRGGILRGFSQPLPPLKSGFWSARNWNKPQIGAMEVYGKSMLVEPSNVIYLSTILNQDSPLPSHKCDMRCQNEHVFGNMYRCKLTGITHICDKNCNQRILYDNHSSLCRASRQIFPLSPSEEQAVKGIRRKLEVENSDGCAFKRRRDAKMHPSPFERSFRSVSPICSQFGDGMDMS